MQRWQRLDVNHDIPDLAGYNIDGTVWYLDRDFSHALKDPAYAEHLGIGPIDTGLSPEDTVECLMEHEGVEKVVIDADNPIDTYLPAHELATHAEHNKVRAKGGTPAKYERGLKKAIEFCETKQLHKVPRDLDCAPYVDEKDKHDLAALEQMKRLGVLDASKLSKEEVDYSESTGEDQCQRCTNWQADRQQAQFHLAQCAKVNGLVRDTHWCRKFQASAKAEADERPDLADQGTGASPI
jgi:hypothetical protein